MTQPPDIVERIAAAAHRSPLCPAILSVDGVITYEELWTSSATIADEIRDRLDPIRPVVAIALHRSPWFIVSALAIWRSGGIVFPTDPNDPSDRQSAIIRRASPSLEISHSNQGNGIKLTELRPEEEGHPSLPLSSEMAYLLSTSGSSGTPKGVLLTRSNLAYFFSWATQLYELGPENAVAGVSPFLFDHSILELFLPLTCGATLILIEKSHRFVDWLERRPIDLLCTVPSAFRSPLALKGLLDRKDLANRLANIHLGGESLAASLVSAIFEHMACTSVTNCYGPTEGTVYATTLRMERAPSRDPSVGYPLPYVNISIRSATGADCDAGEEGEVFISGPGVAAGYLHRYGANNDRFIDVCLPGNGATRAFRTGDIGVLDAAGGLRLLGRSDRQVKIHGHRIELDEVELAITALPSIQECAVVVSKERLIAHIVLDGSTIESTRRMVAKQLPPWMRPMAYVSHTSLPRTTSGKIDRNRL